MPIKSRAAAFLRLIVEAPEDGGILWHCAQGKDRTGWGAAYLLFALGVDKETRIAERKEFLQFVHPDDLPAVMEEIQKDIMEDQDFEGIFRRVHQAFFQLIRLGIGLKVDYISAVFLLMEDSFHG